MFIRRILPIVLVFSLILSSGCARKKEEEPVKKEIAIKKTEGKKKVPIPKEIPTPSTKPITEEKVLFSFERGDEDGWEIPDWALEKDNNASVSLENSSNFASEGSKSLKLETDFPGKMWTGAILEHMQYFDFSPYRELSANVYIPKDAPIGLRAKIILSVGENWKFTEMTRSFPLVPGEWITIRASIEPGSYDWKRTIPNEAFRQDVRKIAIRIESNKKPSYQGPIYIDNVRLGK